MADEWDEAEGAANEGGAGGGFLKLEDGESAVVAFLGKPQNYKAKPFNEGDAPPTKILMNVFVLNADGNGGAIKIFDMNAVTFKALKEIKDKKKYPLERFMFEVSRTGTKSKTRYTIMPEPDPLTPERQKKLETMPLRDLVETVDRISHDAEPSERPARRNSHENRAPVSAPAGGATPPPDDDLPF